MPSTAISRFEYDPESKVLDVWFRGSGRHYRYYDVPARAYEAFRKATSKGRFFNSHIRDWYDFALISEDGPGQHAA
ncbi:MAG: KTSC domain-containing protein [Pseudomonadota bacterium]